MTTNQKAKIAVILTDELGKYVTQCEITNTISAMSKVNIGPEGSVNKVELEKSCNAGRKYLNSISLPLSIIAMSSIYQNQILIAMVKIQKELV